MKIVEEHIGFHYLPTKIQLCTWLFGIEHIPQEVLNEIKDKLITHNVFRIQDNESIICGFYCIVFMEYMLVRKTLLDCTLFSPNDYK